VAVERAVHYRVSMPSATVPHITACELVDRYEALLIDAYGVLITHDGALPGAAELVGHLNGTNKPFFIVTNDASRSPVRSAERYQGLGLSIEVDQIITSGLLLKRHFSDHQLVGARCVVLGTPDSHEYVRNAGGQIVDLATAEDADAVIACDERGFDVMPGLDRVLSLLFRRIDEGVPITLIVPNPDLIYPACTGQYGFTAGALALIFEGALEQRYPDRDDLRFIRLGKPHPPIFEEARRRSGTDHMVMIGDQLATDIRGAARYGIDSALVTTGLTRIDADGEPAHGYPVDARPTYVLDSLRIG